MSHPQETDNHQVSDSVVLGKILAHQEYLKEMLERHFIEDKAAWDRIAVIEKKINWATGYAAAAASFVSFLFYSVAKKIGLIS